MANSISPATRNYLLFLSTILVFAVSYYFVIALPQHNRSKIDLEREKFQTEQKEKESAQERARFNAIVKDVDLGQCIQTAEDNYWTYIKLNGQEVAGKSGTYTASQIIWDRAAKAKKAELDECHRK